MESLTPFRVLRVYRNTLGIVSLLPLVAIVQLPVSTYLLQRRISLLSRTIYGGIL